MNTSLMRFSAKRALEEGSITPKKYTQLLAHIEQMEKQKVTFDEKVIREARRNMLRANAPLA